MSDELSGRWAAGPVAPTPPEPSDPVRPEVSEPEAATTGVPEVDGLLSALDDIDVLPVDEHADVFEDAHRRLHETLLSAGEE